MAIGLFFFLQVFALVFLYAVIVLDGTGSQGLGGSDKMLSCLNVKMQHSILLIGQEDKDKYSQMKRRNQCIIDQINKQWLSLLSGRQSFEYQSRFSYLL